MEKNKPLSVFLTTTVHGPGIWNLELSQKKTGQRHTSSILGETGKIDQVYYGEFDIEDVAIKEQPFQ